MPVLRLAVLAALAFTKLCHLVSDALQVILLALERGCTRRDDIVDFVNQRSRSINPCGKPLPRGFGQLALQL